MAAFSRRRKLILPRNQHDDDCEDNRMLTTERDPNKVERAFLVGIHDEKTSLAAAEELQTPAVRLNRW